MVLSLCQRQRTGSTLSVRTGDCGCGRQRHGVAEQWKESNAPSFLDIDQCTHAPSPRVSDTLSCVANDESTASRKICLWTRTTICAIDKSSSNIPWHATLYNNTFDESKKGTFYPAVSWTATAGVSSHALKESMVSRKRRRVDGIHTLEGEG